MKRNSILNKARYSENTDEWYTDYKTIEKELSHYKSQFHNKIVLCNCDDPYESAFSKYFLKNFNFLGLKKLICTSYSGSKIHKEMELDGRANINYAYALIVDKLPHNTKGVLDDSTIVSFLESSGSIIKLKGDGDFRSDECIKYLKECDIVVTNPPFSKFTEIFSLITDYKKKYLLISNQNAITYKSIFPYIKNNLARVGHHFGDMAFKVPNDTQPRKSRFWIDETGQKWRSLGNAMWLTNLEVKRKAKVLVLKSTYDCTRYPKYDNYDAIHVAKVSEIPVDFEGIMGVPITYFKYHNDKQFEIIGEANHGSDNEFDLFKPKINGKETFKRILIKKSRYCEKTSEFKILDLFCGAGGMSYGMHKNKNFKTVVALDVNEKLAQTFKKNMPEVELVIGDIKDNSVKKKVIDLSIENNVNMIVGGPPCQGFSLKGKKLGLDDPRNFLFVEYLNYVKIIKPDVFVIENVKSLMSTSNGWFKNEIVTTIKQMGYIVSVGIIKASNFGVPQNRERIIFICGKDRYIALPKSITKTPVTVRDAIEDLAYLNSNEGGFEQDYITEANSEYQKLMRQGSTKLYNHKASNHTKLAIEKLTMIPPEKGKEFLPKELLGKQQFSSTWGRLKWDEASPTIDTRFDAASNGRNNHPFLNRTITPREAARLQSFDDKFVFYGNKVDIRTQIGNAVPPLMAKAFADQIYICFDINKGE